MKILIGIPAFNEEKMIAQVVTSVQTVTRKPCKIEILVVDDGSTDATAKIAAQCGASVISHILNRGLGGALKTIFAFAVMNKYDILVTFDADGQHDPRDIGKLIAPIINKKADAVIGSRWLGSRSVPLPRYIVNKLANIMTFFLYGIYSSDSQSGLRAFGKKAINLVKIQTDGMEVSSEIFQNIYRNRLKFSEVPVEPIYTSYSLKKGQQITNAPNVAIQLLLRLLR